MNNKLKYPCKVISKIKFTNIVSRTVKMCSNYSGFIGLLLIGSYAKGTNDIHSDIDFVIVIEDNLFDTHYNSFWNDLQELDSIVISQEMCKSEWISTLENIDRFTYKIDYDLFNFTKFKERLKDNFQTKTGLYFSKILSDKTGFITEEIIKKKTSDISQAEIKYPEVDINKFIVEAWSGLRMCFRGELWESYDILNNLRDSYYTAILCKNNNCPFENYRNIESKFSSSDLYLLLKSVVNPEYFELLEAYKSLLDFVKDYNEIGVGSLINDVLIIIQNSEQKNQNNKV